MYYKSHTDGDSSSIGAYYNARVANTFASSDTISAKDYAYNICAKNWTLPTYTQATVFVNAASTYYGPFSPVLGGEYLNGQLYSGSTYGGKWWTRTGYDNSYHYGFAARPAGTFDAGKWTNPHGFFVRCLV